MFVLHGANDSRVPVGEAEQIVAALRARDVPVDYLRFEDEGHIFGKRASNLAAYPAIARFNTDVRFVGVECWSGTTQLARDASALRLDGLLPWALLPFARRESGMTIPDWGRFYGFTKDSPPWQLLVRAAALAPRRGSALDLGAGAGRDTRYLLEQGFQVTAVDADPRAVALLAEISTLPQTRLRVVQSSFEDFAFATYDLISAQFALPFLPRDRFTDVFARLKAALVPGGIFAGQFFGVHDQWNTPDRSMTFLTRPEAAALLSDLEAIELTEEDVDGHVADGSPKHWHVFHILARRPLPS